MDGEREEKRQREGRTNDTCDDEPTTKEREEGVETSDRGIGRRRKMVEERTAYGIIRPCPLRRTHRHRSPGMRGCTQQRTTMNLSRDPSRPMEVEGERGENKGQGVSGQGRQGTWDEDQTGTAGEVQT